MMSRQRLLWQRATGALHALACERVAESEDITDDVRSKVDGSFLRLRYGTVHYELAGPNDGPTVVLVHGYAVPYYIWDPTFAMLVGAGWRVLRTDLYGRGFSDRPAVPYDADLFDDQLHSLIDALGLVRPVDVVGVSMGAAIAATFASRHPSRARSLALIGPLSPEGGRAPLRLRAPIVGEVVHALTVAPSLAQRQLGDFHQPCSFADWPARFRVQMRYKGFRRALVSTSRSYLTRDARGDYRRAAEGDRRVFLARGEHDATMTQELLAQFRTLLPQAEVHVIPRAGHVPHLEQPESFNPRLLSFLRRG